MAVMQAEAGRPASAVARAGAILLVGALSMTFAEVLSGSSVLWFVTPWGWLVTFWLYLAHTVLFVNLALRYRRTSLPAMYLWGVLFGLYEAWITKVVWAGYLGFAPGWGTLLGFSFPELLIVVFVWHPVFSWILPVLSFEVLGGPGAVLAEHRKLLVRSRRTLATGAGLAVAGGLFLALNAHGNAPAVAVTLLGSAALIALLRRLAAAGGQPVTMGALRLGRRGMTVLLGYLVLLYAAGFALIFPERIAAPPTIALTLGLYALVIVLLRRAAPDAEGAGAPVREAAAPLVTPRDLAVGALVATGVGVLAALALPIAYPLVVIVYLGMVIAGPIVFARVVVQVARPARRQAAGR